MGNMNMRGLCPVLGFIRPVDRDVSKGAPSMQFLQQPQWGNSTTLEHHDDIWLLLHFRARIRRLLTCSAMAGGFGGASIEVHSLGLHSKSDITPRDLSWRVGAGIPHITSCRKRGCQGGQDFWASSSHCQYSHSPCCLALVCPSPLH